MIPLKVHNIIDYIGGAFLLIAPALFGFYEVTIARNLFFTLGAIWILYSLVTRYQYSIAKIIPVKVHMGLDVALGIIILLAPTLLGYREYLTTGQHVFHFIFGLGLIGAVALTSQKIIVNKIPTNKDSFNHPNLTTHHP